MLQFDVKCQELKRIDENKPVKGSSNYLKAKFSFSEDWDGMGKAAIFSVGTGSDVTAYLQVLDEDGMCDVPNNLMKVSAFKLTVFGTRYVIADSIEAGEAVKGYYTEENNVYTLIEADETAVDDTVYYKLVRITTGTEKITLSQTGYTENITNAPAEADGLTEQLIGMVADLSEKLFIDGVEADRIINVWKQACEGNTAYSRKPLNTSSNVIILKPVEDEARELYQSITPWAVTYMDDTGTVYAVYPEYMVNVKLIEGTELEFKDENGDSVEVTVISGSIALEAEKEYTVHITRGLCIVEEAVNGG